MTSMPSLRAVSSCSVGSRAMTSLRWDSFMNYQIWTSARSVTVRFKEQLRNRPAYAICHRFATDRDGVGRTPTLKGAAAQRDSREGKACTYPLVMRRSGVQIPGVAPMRMLNSRLSVMLRLVTGGVAAPELAPEWAPRRCSDDCQRRCPLRAQTDPLWDHGGPPEGQAPLAPRVFSRC